MAIPDRGNLMAIDTFSTSQAARACRVSKQTVRRWIKDGLLKAYRLPDRGRRQGGLKGGPAYLITKADLLDFMVREYLPTDLVTPLVPKRPS